MVFNNLELHDMTYIPQLKRKKLEDLLISIILPVFNEEHALEILLQSILDIVAKNGCDNEIIFINDGSTDNSPEILDRFTDTHSNVRVLHLSRNFGQQAAVQAGIENACGDIIIIMDSDLQDDASAIPRLLEKWLEGFDVVYSIRTTRKENVLKKFMFFSFYRILHIISKTPIPTDAGNFGLIDRSVADEIVKLHEYDRYYPGLRSWVGFNQVGIEVERNKRYDAKPRVSFHHLWQLAKSAIFSFSSFPLTLFYFIAYACMAAFLGTTGFTLYHKFYTKLAIPGWTSTLIAVSFFGAINALGVGIIGEYLIRIYDQVRKRPIYIIKRKNNFPE